MLQYFIEYFLHTNKENITNNLKKKKVILKYSKILYL